MSVTNAMFIFEVVVQSVKSLTSSTALVIRSDFADIFSLELKDPKQMHIVMPEPIPLPPDPPGKKKKAKPKPPKKKKGQVELPPPEPVIQSGQSVLFSSCAEVLSQNMRKFPMEISLWNKEDYLVYIGSVSVPWDPIFLIYLEKLYNCEEAAPVSLNEEYNVFEEGTAKLIAKLGIQVKLSYLGDKVTAAFRTLSEDPTIKKVLYTGMNSKTTSYMCTMKTTDEVFEENCNKVENNYVVDKPRPTNIPYADYKNAPLPQYNIFKEGDYCCMGNADKPPDSIYKAPETCPDINHIIEYVRKIITSCYDNMRMLTPRPTIKPRVKATDIDRLCYCKETNWPENEFAQKFKKDVQMGPCPLCSGPKEKPKDPTENIETFDIANIRGTCGRHDCRVARLIRAYIENLVEEDNKIIQIDDIAGPCGSKQCTLAEKIHQFLRQEGPFNKISTLEALSTQCACLQQMKDTLIKKPPKSSDSSVSGEDESNTPGDDESDKNYCKKKGCPFGENLDPTQVYNVYYFFVQYDANQESQLSASEDGKPKYQYCSSECPSVKASEKTSCSKSACLSNKDGKTNLKPEKENSPDHSDTPSPDDSNVVINFEDIHNPCCVKSCNVVETVKELIVQGAQSEKKVCLHEDPCYCDCDCTFKFTKKTTYCAVCGGYECMGDDLKDMPDFAKPYPCPVYNKLYDKKYIKVQSPWPDETPQKPQDNISIKSTKGSKMSEKRMRSIKSISDRRLGDRKSDKSERKIRSSQRVSAIKMKPKKEEKKKVKEKKVIPKVEKPPPPPIEKPPEKKYPYPPVPKNMGWNWTADDIPGMKVRPKWKPGAANKILVRRYRALREGIDTIAKKKRALMQRKKKLEMKPTLVVKKNNGEYTVQMEVFKKYSNERLVFQYPYEETPPLIYSIGKSEEEQLKIQKQRERKERRETRRKCRLLQSTFRNKCQEICLKAYNQAIGILPLPDPNNPECPCHTDAVKPLTPPIESCSCSEDENISSSDTDNDDWVIEFTPPLARWDPKVKHFPVLQENECQYNYLDFKVKLLDKSGNPVPRFFKGPDGKQECSDLGGFWDPYHFWMEINKDGYIGPDNRWVPMNFTGPDGMFYSAEEGFFTDNSGRTLKIGVDGYIDKDGKWLWYSNRKAPKSVKSKTMSTAATGDTKKAKVEKTQAKANEGGDKNVTAPKTKDKNISKNAPAAATKQEKGNANKVGFGTSKAKNPLIMSVSIDRVHNNTFQQDSLRYNADQLRTDKYSEIMQQIYDDIIELKLPTKANRASNTTRKNFAPLTPQKRSEKFRLIHSTVNGSNTTSES